ncbi:MAG: hypothetical protein FWC20_00550 [Oscillospiraceae bacterium]|nr:hypothetical protein [Oscillospiraceae bacterium]MCL2277882.1 hypothetical protein [Oscillospiraceae bacterium]
MVDAHPNKFLDRKEFDKFYNCVIEPFAKSLQIEYADEGFLYVENRDGVFEAFLNQWSYIRLLIKNDNGYDEDGAKSENDETLLDGHKTAACITTALAQVRIITNSKVDHPPFSIHTSPRLNEQVAVLCGLSYLHSFMLEKRKKEHREAGEEDLCDNFNIVFPKTSHSSKENHYIESLIRGIYYSSLGRGVDSILLAHIYFYIEQYHNQCAK